MALPRILIILPPDSSKEFGASLQVLVEERLQIKSVIARTLEEVDKAMTANQSWEYVLDANEGAVTYQDLLNSIKRHLAPPKFIYVTFSYRHPEPAIEFIARSLLGQP